MNRKYTSLPKSSKIDLEKSVSYLERRPVVKLRTVLTRPVAAYSIIVGLA